MATINSNILAYLMENLTETLSSIKNVFFSEYDLAMTQVMIVKPFKKPNISNITWEFMPSWLCYLHFSLLRKH